MITKMRTIVWLVMGGVLALYLAMVATFSFEGPVALTVHFLRFAVVTAALIIYVPWLKIIFVKLPSPQRDYLLAGLVGFLVSNDYFSILNEVGRIFKIDTSVFTSWISAIGSVIVIVSGSFLILAPDKESPIPPYLAVVIAAILAVALVFVAPQFR